MARPIVELTSGDERTLTFIVTEAGAAVNISAYTEIEMELYATDAAGDPTGAALVTDDMSVGDIALSGGGTGGLFTVPFVAADTASLAGDYYMEIRLTDASGNFLTVTPLTLRVLADLVTS